MNNPPKTVTALFRFHPERWTQGTNARNKWNELVRATDPSACRWCLYAAIIKIYGPQGFATNIFSRFQHILSDWQQTDKRLQDISIVGFNDRPETTYSDIMRLIDEVSLKAGREI